MVDIQHHGLSLPAARHCRELRHRGRPRLPLFGFGRGGGMRLGCGHSISRVSLMRFVRRGTFGRVMEVIDESSEVSGDHRPAALRPGFELPESKFHSPAARPGIVARTALVDRLAAAQAQVITVTAPPGYGRADERLKA